MRKSKCCWMLLACLLGLSIHIKAQDSPRRPNVLLLVSDDQRPDTISHLGNSQIRTPNLDALAIRGLAFTRAVCANPICTPSRAELLTGCSGFTNGVIDFGGHLDPGLELWPEAMKKAGYETWYVGKWHNDGRPIERGFERSNGLFAAGGGRWWKDQTDWKGAPVTGYRGWIFQDDAGNKFPDRGVGLYPDISRDFADAAIELIESSSDKPFFLQVSFTAPHDPLFYPTGYKGRYVADELRLPENFLEEHPFNHGNFDGRDEKLLAWPRTPEMIRELLTVYYSVIEHMDAQIGRIVAALEDSGKLDDTLIIFTSDHGLAVGSHGLRGKQNMYEHTINVPLIIAGPGLPENERRTGQVYLRDLYPTICDWIGIALPHEVDGASFASMFEDSEARIHRHVFCYFRDSQRMIRDDRWKLIHYPQIDRWQLFDLRSDPFELDDLSKDVRYLAQLRRLREVLRSEQERFGDMPQQKHHQRQERFTARSIPERVHFQSEDASRMATIAAACCRPRTLFGIAGRCAGVDISGKQLDQLLALNRFGRVVVASRFETLGSVRRHCVGR